MINIGSTLTRQASIVTGIGLAIVQKIVDNHRGMVSANSAPNSGAEFNIYIPVA